MSDESGAAVALVVLRSGAGAAGALALLRSGAAVCGGFGECFGALFVKRGGSPLLLVLPEVQ